MLQGLTGTMLQGFNGVTFSTGISLYVGVFFPCIGGDGQATAVTSTGSPVHTLIESSSGACAVSGSQISSGMLF